MGDRAPTRNRLELILVASEGKVAGVRYKSEFPSEFQEAGQRQDHYRELVQSKAMWVEKAFLIYRKASGGCCGQAELGDYWNTDERITGY